MKLCRNRQELRQQFTRLSAGCPGVNSVFYPVEPRTVGDAGPYKVDIYFQNAMWNCQEKCSRKIP